MRGFKVPLVLLGVTFLLACATLDYPPPPPRPPEQWGGSVDVSYFYDQLSPYGEWAEVSSYGWVWSPRGVAAEWRPYTLGHWVYTDDDGWLWVSDEEWGWAAYHYGRWYNDSLLEPRAYCFVEERHFTEERIVSRVVPVRQNLTIVNSTRNTTNYNIVQSRIVNRSIAVENVEGAVGHAVPRARSVGATSLSGPHRAQVQGNEVKVFRPAVQPVPADRKPVSALPRGPLSGSGVEAERARLEQKHAQEKAALEARHTKEIQNPPKGVSMDQVKARHESEHQAQDQKHQKETQRAVSRQESQAPKKPR